MATLTVGTGKQYATIAAAIAATNDGDTVLVQAGVYLNDFATITHKITLMSVGGQATLQATQSPPNGKAILTIGTDVTIDGFGFTGSAVADSNGAGIRYEGGNLVVRNSVFWNNQDGILANDDPNGTILIDHSEFSHNGAGDGYSHGIYINHVKSLTVTNSYFHDVLVGHEIKSRAYNTTISGNRILDNTVGTGSYSIDLPNGGNGIITNNVIEKGANTENNNTIHFGGEGTAPDSSTLLISGNTIVNDRADGSLLLNQTNATVVLTNNALYGFAADHIAQGPVAASGNTTLTSRPTLDMSTAAPPVVAGAPPAALPPAPDVSVGTVLVNSGPNGAVVASGRILTVGQTGQFRTLMSALAASRDGDTIRVAAGTYVNDFADINHKVIIEGVGGIAKFVQVNDLDRNQGVFVANTDATIRNVELSGAVNWSGREAGLFVGNGTVTLVNSIVDGNNIGIVAADNVGTNLTIYNSDIGGNDDVAKGTHNVTIGAINSFTMRGSYIYGSKSGHELSDRAFNSDIETNRFVDGANIESSFLIDLGAGGNNIIKNNLLVKGAQSANGVLVHVGGEATTYANSNTVISGNTLVSLYDNPGHPYTYFINGDTTQALSPITATNNSFQGGVPGGRWLTNVTDGGGNVTVTGTPINAGSAVSMSAIPAMFKAQGGSHNLNLVLSERKGGVDMQFVVAVDGVIAGGGVVTAATGTGTQAFNFAGNWTAGAHTVTVSTINAAALSGGLGLTVNNLSLDGRGVSPNLEIQGSYSATLSASAQLGGFDPTYYLAHNPDVAAANIDPLQHFLTFGWHEGRNPNAYFDTNYYLAQNPDVAASGIDPLVHYDLFGWKEGRDPSLLFSDSKGLATYGGVNPLTQFLVQGRYDGDTPALAGGTRAADPLVDAAYYDRQLGASLIPTGTAAAQQAAWSYDTTGWQKGLNPSQFFDTKYYLAHNPDVAAAHVDPLVHFETIGWKEGRDPSAAFSTTKYLAAYSDVAKAGVDPLLHYVQFGQTEGRSTFAV